MNLYRRKTFQASLALLLACAAAFTTASAQRRKPHKLRATAVLELTTERTGTVTARLTPVTILIEGRFEDASIYKAAPEPMALEPGTVYEAQKTGVPAGYVTVGTAANAGMWKALARWQVASEAKKSEPAPVTANPADERPRLHRGDAAAATASPSPTPGATPQPVAAKPSEPEPPEDPDRPVLRRRSPPGVQPAPETTPEAQSKPEKSPQAASAAAAPGPHTAPPAQVQTMVAVSDAQSIETRSFVFLWKPGEQEQMEAKMRKLALAQLPHGNIRPAEASLKNVVIRSFDLDLSNDAVMVLTAEAPISPAAPGKQPPANPVTRYITLIARVDFEGVPKQLAVSVTDSSRLDVAPRLELIDAVDVDGDTVAELLFREYGFDEKGFVVYTIGRSTVTKIFEGATEPIR